MDESPPSPQQLRLGLGALVAEKRQLQRQRAAVEARLAETRQFLALAPQIEEALRILGERLFEEIVRVLEDNLSKALMEVLEQPIRLRAVASYKRSNASVEFHIERNGQKEDILRGQGGSVANILSVGLRMFALATLDPAEHRHFLVLDEQDCWLRPDLVPKLVKIVHDAARQLGFQVILISHHNAELFRQHVDRIYRFEPQRDGSVRVEVDEPEPRQADRE